MMNDLIALYQARVARLERGATSPRSLDAARALLDAARRAADPAAFQRLDASGRLSLRAAIARVEDTEARRAAHYDSLGEHVRAAPSHEILRVLASTPPGTEEELISIVNSTHLQANARITADEELRTRLWNQRESLDDHEVLQRAEVPPEWHAAQATSTARKSAEIQASFARDNQALAGTVPGWQPRWEDLAAPRHRRRLPWSDAELADRIARYRALVGGR